MKIIRSTNDNQADIIADIANLHCKGSIDADVTYGAGAMWKNTGLDPQTKFDLAPRTNLRPEPCFKFDIKPSDPEVIKADCRRLPVRDREFKSIMFDPPFISGSDGDRAKQSIYADRGYGVMPTHNELIEFYKDSMIEFLRVLKTDGKLIFKNQDYVDGREQYFAHCKIFNLSLQVGFKPIDLFVLLAKTRPIAHNLKKQQYARKYHCYFWVLRKPRKRRKSNDAGKNFNHFDPGVT